MQLTMEWKKIEKTMSIVPSSNVLMTVIGSGPRCAMWQFKWWGLWQVGWWGLRTEMPSDKAH
jgi:hypothetical protein